MGNKPIYQTWDIYGRRKDNEKYEHICNIKNNVFCRWKHETFCYALEKRYEAYKSIYLYKNTYVRVAKANLMLKSPYFELEFKTPKHAEAFDEAEEQINDLDVQVPWLFHKFDKNWTQVNSGSLNKRVYKKNCTLTS